MVKRSSSIRFLKFRLRLLELQVGLLAGLVGGLYSGGPDDEPDDEEFNPWVYGCTN